MDKVNVLLSSYNGEKYIKTLLDSVLSQENVDVDLLVRDDASSDTTIDILQSYQAKKQLNLLQGENMGPARSFLFLLQHSHDANYYAFADEDDFWEKEKLSVAIEKLQKSGKKPALYFSRTQPTDNNLNPIPSINIHPKLTFAESLVYAYASGCTMVLNKSLRDILNTYTPNYIPMHDYWIISVALAIGADVIFDTNSYILYRQHTGNTVGMGKGKMYEWKRRILRLLHQEESRSRMAQEIYQGFRKDIDSENLDTLQLYIEAKKNIFKRIHLLFESKYQCADPSTWHKFKLAVLLNTY
jgi:rhamnosyltransferase